MSAASRLPSTAVDANERSGSPASSTTRLPALSPGVAELSTWLALGVVPFYLVWKLAITLKAVFRMREKTWVKTTRN